MALFWPCSWKRGTPRREGRLRSWGLAASCRSVMSRVRESWKGSRQREIVARGEEQVCEVGVRRVASAGRSSSIISSWDQGARRETEGPSLADLPDELVGCIVQHLHGKDVARSAALVCRHWGKICWAEDGIWQQLYYQDFCRGERVEREHYCLDWRQAYMLEHQWRNGTVTHTKYEGLSSHVYNVDFSTDSNMIVGRSVDGLTKIWDRKNGTCMHTVAGARLMSCVQCDEKKIVGASLDGSIVVWDVETRQILRTLVGHAHLATCIQFDDKKVVSGSLDRTIRVWNAETGECLQTLTGHKSTVMCLKMKNSLLVSGSNDGTVKVWDLNTGECLHTLLGHQGWVSCVDFNDVHIVSGSHDCTLRVWSLETGKRVGKLRGHSGSIMCVQLQGKRVVSGSLDCRVRVWDLLARKCVRSFRGHTSYVSCVKFNEKAIISGGDDGSIRCWDLID